MTPSDARADIPLKALNDTSQESSKPTTTPLPWRQLSILLLLQLAGPLTGQVIAPFLPQVRESTHQLSMNHRLILPLQMIRRIGVTHGDDTQIGYYVGLVVSPVLHVR